MPMDLLCRLQGENKRLKEQNDDLLAALQIVKDQRQHWWGKAVTRGAELFLRSSVVPCTYPDCLSARAVQVAGEEVEKLVAKLKGGRLANFGNGYNGEFFRKVADGIERLQQENANLRANVNGFTFCHSDAAVMEEMGMLRVEVERVTECADDAWQRGKEQGIKAGMERMRTKAANAMRRFHDGRVKAEAAAAVIMGIPVGVEE